jgi:uncharacterized protein (TIGR03435 family)
VTVASSVVIGAVNAPRRQAQLPAIDAAGLSFEVASVKPNKSGEAQLAGIMFPPGGRFMARNATLRELILAAYGEAIPLHDSQIVGGPVWVNSDRFDIDAKAASEPPPGAVGPPPLMFAMLRTLLRERFKLSAHLQTREMPIYALVMARSDGRLGPQLRQSDVDCDAVRATRARGGPPQPPAAGEAPLCGSIAGPGRLTARAATLVALAGWYLSGIANRIVIDRTGLTGVFDWTLEWSPEALPQPLRASGAPPTPPGDPNGPSIFTALQEQLGLKLESARGPVDVLVIDSVQQPTPD